MDYQILEKEAFRVVGKSIQVSTQENEHSRQIAKFWEACNQDGTAAKLSSKGKDENLLGIMVNMHTYMIACKTDLTSCEEGFTSKTIPASSWATFTSVGPLPGSIQNLFVRIYQEWFPSTGFEHAKAPILEIYPPGDTSAKDYRCEVWIPIAKK
jgi:AraC family transcriptional regulator